MLLLLGVVLIESSVVVVSLMMVYTRSVSSPPHRSDKTIGPRPREALVRLSLMTGVRVCARAQCTEHAVGPGTKIRASLH